MIISLILILIKQIKFTSLEGWLQLESEMLDL